MRITGGNLKGLKIITPSTKNQIRPLSDKTRQIIFNVLGQYLDGLDILDCFGGTGAFSLESISRNARFTYIIEKSTNAINIIKNNFIKANIPKDKYLIRKANLWTKLETLEYHFDIIFFDPPYNLITENKINEFLNRSQLFVKNDFTIILKVPNSIKKNKLLLNNFSINIKTDGITNLFFLEKG